MSGSFDKPGKQVAEASPWVQRFCAPLAPASRVLDVACGTGRHARHLLAAGHHVTAVDIDISGAADLAALPGCTLLELDLESGAWPFPAGQFDAIVMTNYLHRPLLPVLAAALAPGGRLVIETFGDGNAAFGRPRNPDFLLHPGELYDALAPRLHVLAYEHGYESLPRPAVRQRICAVHSDYPSREILPAAGG